MDPEQVKMCVQLIVLNAVMDTDDELYKVTIRSLGHVFSPDAECKWPTLLLKTFILKNP